MKKRTKIIISLCLAFCMLVPSVSVLLYNLLHRPKGGSGEEQVPTVNAVSTQFSGHAKAYAKTNFVLSTGGNSQNEVAEDVNENTVLNYTTSLQDNPSTKVEVELSERIDSLGNMKDTLTINGIVYGELGYDGDGNLSSYEINYNNVYYEYEEGKIAQFINNGKTFDYNYVSGKLANIEYDGEPHANFTYSDYGKIQQEAYINYQRLYEQTNVATLEYAYNPDTGAKILARTYDYVNDNPYTITKSIVSDNGKDFEVVSQVKNGEKIINFEYNYFYNNKPYITHVSTYGEDYSLSYINDKLLTKTTANEISTFVYSSTGELVGMVYGKLIDGEFNSMFIAFIRDGWGNIIEANYLNITQDAGEFSIDVSSAYEQQFDSVGHRIFISNNTRNSFTNFGFKGGLTFEDVNLVYLNGELYSPLLADCLTDGSADDINTRSFVTAKSNRENPTLNTIQKGVAVESLQNEILQTYDTSSISNVKLVNNEFTIGSADVYTLPVNIDGNNILKYPSKVFFMVNLDNAEEVANYQALLSSYFAEDSVTYVLLDDYYLASLSTKDLTYQFVYNSKLFTVKYVQPGLYGYEIKSAYTSADYNNSSNIINYDTGRYITYVKSTIDVDNYIDDISFVSNISSTEDVDNYLGSLGLISTTLGETYQDANFGDNAEFVKNLIKNTCDFKMPDYDPKTQYIAIDEFGNYVVQDIPEDAKVEEDINAKMAQIFSGIDKVVRGIMIISSGVLLCVASGGAGIAMVCGVIASIGGAVVTVCGLAQINRALTGYDILIDKLMHGDLALLETVVSIASFVSSVAIIVGSLTIKQCFVAGTAVATPMGAKNIEDIQVGDYVLSYDPATGKQSYNRVVNTYVREVSSLCTVAVGGQTITSSLNHPYYVDGEWVAAQDLQIGDNVLLSNGSTAQVESVELLAQDNTKVYNLNVENDHTYYAEDVLVHNNCSKNEFTDPETDKLYKSKEYRQTMDEFKKKYPDVNFNDKAEASKFWKNHRPQFNKALGNRISQNAKLRKTIVNYEAMMKKGVNPIVKLADGSVIKLQYHHYFGKLGGHMFDVYPMSAAKHMQFHDIYGRNDPSKWTGLAKYITNLVR